MLERLTEPDRVVVVAVAPIRRGLGREVAGDDVENRTDGAGNDQEAVNAQRIVLAGTCHGDAGNGQKKQEADRELTLARCELCDHRPAVLLLPANQVHDQRLFADCSISLIASPDSCKKEFCRMG